MKLSIQLIYILLATGINGFVALVGGFTLFLNDKNLNKVIKYFVAFSAGTLFSGALFHLYAESIDEVGIFNTNILATTGFLLFFVLERYLWWHHCHEGKCETHPVSYLILIGDGIHNFLDGMLIAAAFLTDFKVGLLTTILVIFHEIPQELGDFGVLVHGGFAPKKALFMNFISQLTAVAGGVLTYFTSKIFDISPFLVGIAAGGFLYISASDLIPEIHEHLDEDKAFKYIMLFIAGIIVMVALKFTGE